MVKKLAVGLLVLTMVLGTFAVYADGASIQNECPMGRIGNSSLEERGLGVSRGFQLTEDQRENFLKEKEDFFGERDTLTEEERQEWFEKRMEYKRATIKENLSNGLITEEQANILEKHLQEREEYHKENGFNKETCDGQGNGGRMNNERPRDTRPGAGQEKGQNRGQGKGLRRANNL